MTNLPEHTDPANENQHSGLCPSGEQVVVPLGLLERIVAALVAPSSCESFDQILSTVPSEQRAAILKESIVHLAKTRVSIGRELQVTATDIAAMRIRGAARELASLLSGENVSNRLIPSEILARERALTEVAAVLHVAHGRDISQTNQVLRSICHFAAQSSIDSNAAGDGLITQVNPRRRDILRRSVERVREQSEVERVLRERLRQIVHRNLQCEKPSEITPLSGADSIAAQVVVQRIRQTAQTTKRVTSGRAAYLHRHSLRRASVITKDELAECPDNTTRQIRK